MQGRQGMHGRQGRCGLTGGDKVTHTAAPRHPHNNLPISAAGVGQGSPTEAIAPRSAPEARLRGVLGAEPPRPPGLALRGVGDWGAAPRREGGAGCPLRGQKLVAYMRAI